MADHDGAPPANQRAYSADAVMRLLGQTASGGAGDLFRALYLPSFHAETLITVELTGDDGVIAVTSFERSLWYALAEREQRQPPTLKDRLLVKRGLGVPEPELPSIWREHTALGRERAARFRAGLEDCLVGALAPAPRSLGCDGMTLVGEVRRAGSDELHRVEAWSPRPGAPRHGYFAALHQLAREALTSERVQSRIEQLHGYLGLGLPAKDLGGVPRRVRIFGRLSSDGEPALRAFFATLPSDVPLIVDMSNFEFMGTLLYPVFRDLHSQSGPIAWVASEPARQQLADMGIPGGAVFDDIATAIRSLET